MTNNSKVTVSGVFRSREDLTETINYLEELGVPEKDISILMSEEEKNKQFTIDTDTKAPEGAIRGFITGGLIGATIGGLTLVGAIIAPGIGFVLSGPIIGIFTGITTGGLIGSLIGGLIGFGIPEYEAKFYEKSLNDNGKILLVAQINNDLKNEAKKQFNKYGAYHIATQ